MFGSDQNDQGQSAAILTLEVNGWCPHLYELQAQRTIGMTVPHE